MATAFMNADIKEGRSKHTPDKDTFHPRITSESPPNLDKIGWEEMRVILTPILNDFKDGLTSQRQACASITNIIRQTHLTLLEEIQTELLACVTAENDEIYFLKMKKSSPLINSKKQ